MNAAVKEKWLKALQSGKFKQARDQLKDGDAFCCLGVLCELHRCEVGGEWRESAEYKTSPEYYGSPFDLPSTVAIWAGLTETNPFVKTNGEKYSLGHLNDRGFTFSQIAELIEAQL